MKEAMPIKDAMPITQRSWTLRLLTWRWTRYIVLSGLANAFIWGSTFSYLKVTKPTYTSNFAMIVTGAGFGINFSLPEIGQASSSNGTGMGSSTYDPRANYEFLFTSEPVMQLAAQIANIPFNEFGKPRIKLIDNTTMMTFEITGRSPEEARKKCDAVHKAIVKHLDILRTREVNQRIAPTQKILQSAQKKLQTANEQSASFKVHSGLSFPDQVNNLSTNIEQLRRQRAETIALEQQTSKRLQQLSADVGLSSDQAADAFLLQADQEFQLHLKDYSEATAALDVLMGKFDINHPQVMKETKRQDAAKTALSERATALLRRAVDPNLLITLSLNAGGAGRDPIFQNILSYQADQRGLVAQVKTLDHQIKQLENRLALLAQRQSTLDNLKRTEQIAEAVFASTLAKVDLGMADVFAAYPLVQLAVEPSLPYSPTAPKKEIILAGAAVGSLFTTLGLTLLWIRKPWLKKLSKFIST
jgi:uncharacterized protein involved in exopolysaccharide biosynthesis